jgi:hypothetical protein
MNQAQAQGMFYGNPATDPRQYLGLATRYGAISGAGNAPTSSTPAASRPTTRRSTSSVGARAPLRHLPEGVEGRAHARDLGEDDVLDANGNTYRAAKSLYQWDNGLVVKDWRYVVRICNINTANLVAESSSGRPHQADGARGRSSPVARMCRPAFYMNRTCTRCCASRR